MSDPILGTCDFCKGPVMFVRVEIGPGPFTELKPLAEGAGSDYLATWCASCGPKHRKS